jgi:hypothetical protein
MESKKVYNASVVYKIIIPLFALIIFAMTIYVLFSSTIPIENSSLNNRAA